MPIISWFSEIEAVRRERLKITFPLTHKTTYTILAARKSRVLSIERK
jgi:hypothetical protein